MKVILDLCVVPIGAGVQLAPYIAVSEKVLSRADSKSVPGSLAGPVSMG
jgi:uncharacterized protein YqgV (UPF0045/DUF77 family)